MIKEFYKERRQRMKKVITYGTFDLLHYGHIRLLERARALGDYLIVGVTSDDFDKTRGKINVQQSLSERVASVRATGLADKIIVEEYEGQKIDDIKKYGVDVFTVGSDWVGKFDYLNDYCTVKYLDRTQGVSSTELRQKDHILTMGIIGNTPNFVNKFQSEDRYVNCVKITGVCYKHIEEMSKAIGHLKYNTPNYKELLKNVDTIYINNDVDDHYKIISDAINMKKHILCESPICDDITKARELARLAKKNKVVLMDAIRTAYSTAYSRLVLLVKAGKIGKVLSIDATCTDMSKIADKKYEIKSFERWGPNCLLPIFQILGTKYKDYRIISQFKDKNKKQDIFTKIDFIYENATASIKVAEGAKSEGELIITGTEGYIYVPAPWWKTDYFEIRCENSKNNKRFFYQLDGEGIRYELVSFAKAVNEGKSNENIESDVSLAISKMAMNFKEKKKLIEI